MELIAAADDDGRRLDRILRKAMRDLPLSAIHRLLRKGAVRVDGERAPADLRIRQGQAITLISGLDALVEAKPPAPPPSNAGLPEILFEGAGLLVLNKPAGIAVHGKESLEDQVRSYLGPKIPPSLSFRPGPLHRLDKPSTGIIAFSASLEGARFFSSLMRERKVKKFYLALVEGLIEKAETWQDELVRENRSKKAISRLSPLAGNALCSLVLAEIETGRTHQIRAQAASRGHPLLGDRKYGGRNQRKAMDEMQGFLLHAWRMEFPQGNQGSPLPHRIEAPLPEKFQRKIRELFGRNVKFPD